MMIKSLITTHVLDLTKGKPAHGIRVVLEHRTPDGGWASIGTGLTDVDGRISDLLPEHGKPLRGVYRLTFETESYFESTGVYSFYPYIPIVFELQDGVTHQHIPLLLSPFGYSTYRGS
jgi:5-hydroxyisourate hydrolase